MVVPGPFCEAYLRIARPESNMFKEDGLRSKLDLTR
jgi:hypothetical protein